MASVRTPAESSGTNRAGAGAAGGLERYCAALREAGLDAPWARPGPLILPKATHVVPRLWRWSEIEPLVTRSADLVTPDRGAERRILRLDNPGVPERTATHTISVAVQYLLSGEVAPAHRHTPNAIRFMLRGQAAYTTVDGDRCEMRPGDLVLTPSMAWHDHGNEGPDAAMWIDVLDSPIVRYLENLSMEPFPEDRQPPAAVGRSERRFAHAGLRSAWRPPRAQPHRDHLLHWRWATTEAALQRLATSGPVNESDSRGAARVSRAASEPPMGGLGGFDSPPMMSEPSPFDDVIMEYVDPVTGRSVTPALGCYVQLLRPGVRTRVHRETSSAVYHAVRGEGRTTVDDVTFEWRAGDFFVVPPGARHGHENDAREPAILFSVQDVPLLAFLGLYRAEADDR